MRREGGRQAESKEALRSRGRRGDFAFVKRRGRARVTPAQRHHGLHLSTMRRGRSWATTARARWPMGSAPGASASPPHARSCGDRSHRSAQRLPSRLPKHAGLWLEGRLTPPARRRSEARLPCYVPSPTSNPDFRPPRCLPLCGTKMFYC